MGINPDDLNLIIEQAIQKVLQTNQNTSNYYKNMNKHKNCSQCSSLITTENYKKDRSVCKNCYNSNTLILMKRRFGVLEKNSSSKQDSSSNQDISDIQDSSNKQVRARKQTSSNKQDRSSKQVSSNKQDRSSKQNSSNKQDKSSKQDISSNNIIDMDPNLFCDELREILSKSDRSESDNTMVKMIIDALLRTECKTQKQYKAICKNNNFQGSQKLK